MTCKVTIHDNSNPVIGPAIGGTKVFIHDGGGDPSRNCAVTVHDTTENHPEIAPGVRLGDLSGAPHPETKVVIHDAPPPTRVIIHEKPAAPSEDAMRAAAQAYGRTLPGAVPLDATATRAAALDDDAALRLHEGIHDLDKGA